MGVSECVCVSASECKSRTSREDSAIFLCANKVLLFCQKCKNRSDLNPNTSDFSQNANLVECHRLIVEQKCKKQK